MVRILDSILVDTRVKKEDIFTSVYGKESLLKDVTQKMIYEETLQISNSRDHHSQGKILSKLDTVIEWDHLWNSVHNFLSSNEIKTAIWQQLHLNFYTQFSYNKWHKKMDPCSICLNIPQSIFHIMLDCNLVNDIWQYIQPLLVKLYPLPITDSEKVLGIVKNKPSSGILLRNWVTFLLRKVILEQEKVYFHKKTAPTIYNILSKFEKSLHDEIRKIQIRYNHVNQTENFEKLICYKNVLCKRNINGKFEYIQLI